jgi:predicted amidophosphoribosyltransferase
MAPSGPVCGPCLRSLPLLGGRLCARCGMPTDLEVRECRSCRGRRLEFATARAGLAYEARARDLVHAFKDRAQRGLAGPAAALVAVAVPEPPADVLTWVPADRWRRIQRGYHPPELLARSLAGLWAADALPLLEAAGRRRPQRGLDSAARRANVRGAFRAAAAAPVQVVLVDDVHTTGATLSAAARELRRAGAEQVHAVTLARAVPRVRGS